MSYTPPVDQIAATWVGANPYGVSRSRLDATWDDSGTLYASPAGVKAWSIGTPRLNDQIEPPGIAPVGIGAARALHPDDYLTPQYLIHASWVGKNPYAGRGANVLGSWSETIEIQPVGFTDEVFSDPVLTWQEFASPEGFDNLLFGTPRHVTLQSQYREPIHTINASWVGADPFTPSAFLVSASWAGAQQIFPLGVDESLVPEPALRFTQTIQADGLPAGAVGADVWALHWYEYRPHVGRLDASWLGKAPYTPKASPNVHAWWTVTDDIGALGTLGWDSALYGTPAVRNQHEYVTAVGSVFLTFGAPKVEKNYIHVTAQGFNASAMGTGHLLSWRKFLSPPGGVRTSYGTPKVDFYDRNVRPTGTNMAAFGAQRLTNAIRYLRPVGFSALGFSNSHRIDLRVRYVSPSGFVATRYGQSTSIANVTFDQLVRPASLQATVWGFPELELWKRFVLAAPILSDLRFGNQTELYNFDRQITTFGTPFQRMGTPQLEEVNYTRTIRPAPILGGIGTPAVANKNLQIRPESWVSVRFAGLNTTIAIDEFGKLYVRRIDPPLDQVPAPEVFLYSRYLLPAGWVAWRVGSPTVWHEDRPIAPAGIVATRFGTAVLDRDLRYLIVPPISAGAAGSPTIQLRLRYVFTQGSITVRFGTAMMGRDLAVHPSGLAATRWGTTIVRDNTQFVSPLGFVGAWGVAQVRLLQRHLHPAGILTPEFSRWASVQNLRRYVVPFTDTAATWGPWFGSSTQMLVWNRDRQITGIGTGMSRVPIGAVVYNNARVVAPSGLSSLAFGPGGFIAERVRPVLTPGIEPPPILRWTTVRNTAQVVSLHGAAQTIAGMPAVLNRNRTINHYPSSHLPDSVFGIAFIADAVRTLSFYSGIPPLTMGFARVFNSDQFIRPPGYAWHDGTGAHHVHEHFNIIGPVRTVLQTRWGEPRVWNKTPQLYAYGHDSVLFGATRVRLQFRFVLALSPSRMDLYGKPVVRDRRTWVTVQGVNAARYGLQLVKLANPDLPWPQIIDLEGHGHGPPMGGGSPASTGWWGGGAANVYANSIYPPGFSGAGYGTPEAYLQGIRPDSILPAENFSRQFGVPLVNPWFWAAPDGIPPIMPSRTDSGTIFTGDGPTKHRISPHTIWCTPATQQAESNHANRLWRRMDEQVQLSYTGPRWPWWGRPRVENRNRSIAGIGAGFETRWGSARVQLRVRYVRPDGFRAFKYGVPELFGGSRNFQFYGFVMSSMGNATVQHKAELNRTVRQTGNNLQFLTGANLIMLFHRQVHPSGGLRSLYGTAWVSRSPRFLQAPAGIAPRPFGTPWVSYRVREVHPQGADQSWIEGYSYDTFSWRLRVHGPNRVTLTAGDQGMFGLCRVENGIRVVQQADHIGPPQTPRPRVDARSIIALGGFGFAAGAFGDIDRWEEGKVKPHGDDLSAIGMPRTRRRVAAGSIEGAFGTARLGRQVYGEGFDTLGIGMPATPLLNPHICGSTARVMVPHHFVHPSLGNPAVGHA